MGKGKKCGGSGKDIKKGHKYKHKVKKGGKWHYYYK